MSLPRRPNGTSVRDRIAAIENTVIRAKYEPDVRGVNRFRHFHTPISVHSVTNNGFESKEDMTHLPSLVNTGQQKHHESKDAGNGLEKGSQRNKQNFTLPKLTNSAKQTLTKSENITAQKLKLKEKINEQKKINKTAHESDSFVQLNYTGKQLGNSLDFKNTPPGAKRTFASLSRRQNGAIINRPTSDFLEVSLPPRSKSAQAVDVKEEKLFPTGAPSLVDLSTSIPQNSKNIATQTSRKHISTASVEFLNCVRSTQTDSTPIVISSRRKSDLPPNLQDIEEREALLEVIEDALGETFDRYSRVRTNQIIANSARKQAQIWRDVKDFIGGNLFPTAIQLANKSQTRSKTTAEIVASIKMYP